GSGARAVPRAAGVVVERGPARGRDEGGGAHARERRDAGPRDRRRRTRLSARRRRRRARACRPPGTRRHARAHHGARRPGGDGGRTAGRGPPPHSRAGGVVIRIVIVDDHAVVREGIRTVLAGDPEFEVVGEAADGVAAVACARDLRPDVLLLDITMPGGSGLEALPRILHAAPGTRVLMLTVHDDNE